MIEPKRIYYRHTTRSRIIIKNRTSDFNQGRTVINHQKLVLAEIGLCSEISDSKTWNNQGSGAMIWMH